MEPQLIAGALPIDVNIDGALLVALGLLASLTGLGFAGLRQLRAEGRILVRLRRHARWLGRPDRDG
ncbi:MAG: hypothetical protein J0H01_25140 [Rhizobiales bacterium]|nr:hypothetical protein [Hyphomicrobiales bacterium]